MAQEQIDIIKNTTSQLLAVMGFEGGVEVSLEQGVVKVDIESPEPEFLIGTRGDNLKSLHHILKLILKSKIKEPFFLNLDVNDYKKRKEISLKELAKSLAEKVINSKRIITLRPMSAYERRIIHLELASSKNVVTESVGEEPERRLIIKPYP